MDQHHKLAEVIRESFKVITKKTLFENAFPSIESCPKLARHCLYMAAKSKNANAIKERVKEDENFARNLQDLVILSPFCFSFSNIAITLSGSRSCWYASNKCKGFSCQGCSCWV
jgi:hypothetical protein